MFHIYTPWKHQQLSCFLSNEQNKWDLHHNLIIHVVVTMVIAHIKLSKEVNKQNIKVWNNKGTVKEWEKVKNINWIQDFKDEEGYLKLLGFY